MTSAPPVAARLVVDTDVASFIFKWNPEFAPRFANILRGAKLVISFMTLAEIRSGALRSSWGQRRLDVLEAYLSEFKLLHTDNGLCSAWAAVRDESRRKGRPIGTADAWIAATALYLGVPLVTNNPKDYRHLDTLQILSM
jgi:predicted nucleic acid-binding protein